MAPTRVECIADIRSRWNITTTEYNQVCVEFQKSLKEAGIWGLRMQGMAIQQALEETINDILQTRQFRRILARIEPYTLHNDFRRLAQVLSRNERRREERSQNRQSRRRAGVSRTKPLISVYTTPPRSESPIEVDGRPSSIHSSSVYQAASAQSRPRLSTTVTQPAAALALPPSLPALMDFASCMIVVRRQRGIVRIYRPSDFSVEEGATASVKVDDLLFEKFISTLVSDMEYGHDKDILSYHCAVEGTIYVPSDRVWKAALWDMYSQGQRHLKFTFQRRK